MADQKIGLRIEGSSTIANMKGSRFNDKELDTLGIDEGTPHLKIDFDNNKAISYMCLSQCLLSIVACYFPIFLICPCCIYKGIKEALNSRRAAVTDKVIVLRQGYYTCCCICWNESTKSVALNKVTDLSISQNCCQKMFDIKTLKVENASSVPGAPEFAMVCNYSIFIYNLITVCICTVLI